MERKKLEALVWKHTHKDFKGKCEKGCKMVLHNGGAAGTLSVPLSFLSEAELWEKLPAKALDPIVEAAYYKTCSGIAIPVLDIPKVFAVGRRSLKDTKGDTGVLENDLRSYVESLAGIGSVSWEK